MTSSAHRLDDTSKIRTVDVTESTEKRSFSDLHLGPNLTQGLTEAKYVSPSPVQWKSLPLANLGLDLVIQAKSGTGKTLVFVISALNMIKLDLNSVQVIMIAPTREIAVQGARAVLDVAKGAKMDELKVHTFIGGMSLTDDMVKAKRCHIAVGTPGRIRALINSKNIDAKSTRLFVLDEADKLMESAFRSDLTWIFNQLPAHKQVIALSATYPKELESMVMKFMTNSEHVQVNPESNVLLGVSQFWLSCPSSHLPNVQSDIKFKLLLEILNKVSFSQCLIFSNYSVRAESICEKLEANGWPVMFLAGIMDQRDRLRALQSLKQFSCRVLITTDLSARGIDAANVNLVINMEVPWETSTYLHRIGRCGRFGSYGIAITLASEGKETQELQEVVYETSSDIYKLEKVVETNEYEIPDLWKLKQSNELEKVVIDLELLKGIEPQPKQKNSVKTEQTGDQNSEQSGSLSDIFTSKRKKSAEKSDKKIKNEQVDEFTVKKEYVQEQYENEQYYGQNEQHYGQNEHEQYYGHTEHDAYNGQNDDYYEQNGENYAENDHIAENKADNFEEENELLPEDFLIQEFQKAIGEKFNKEPQLEQNGIEAVEKQFKTLLNGYVEKFPEEKKWPLNMSDIKKGEIFPGIPQMDEKDKKQFNELGQKIFEHKMNTFSNRVQMNKDALANCDLKEAINDLLDGKELVVKTDPLNNWQLVEETLLNESIQSQDEQVTIFDLTGLKVELDDDYFFDENEDQNIFEDDSSSLATTDYQTEQEVDPMAWHPVEKKDYQSYRQDLQPANSAVPPPFSTHNYSSTFQETSNLWNPFPDPDAGLPSDLYEIHRNQWLRSQYQLWLQKVQENKALVEQYYFQK